MYITTTQVFLPLSVIRLSISHGIYILCPYFGRMWAWLIYRKKPVACRLRA